VLLGRREQQCSPLSPPLLKEKTKIIKSTAVLLDVCTPDGHAPIQMGGTQPSLTARLRRHPSLHFMGSTRRSPPILTVQACSHTPVPSSCNVPVCIGGTHRCWQTPAQC
jgi:hypothetical protein